MVFCQCSGKQIASIMITCLHVQYYTTVYYSSPSGGSLDHCEEIVLGNENKVNCQLSTSKGMHTAVEHFVKTFDSEF